MSSVSLLVLLNVQILLGILILINASGTIPVFYGVMHQAIAIFILMVVLYQNYYFLYCKRHLTTNINFSISVFMYFLVRDTGREVFPSYLLPCNFYKKTLQQSAGLDSYNLITTMLHIILFIDFLPCRTAAYIVAANGNLVIT